MLSAMLEYNTAAILTIMDTLVLRLCARRHRPFHERMYKWVLDLIIGEWSNIGGVTEQMHVRIPGQ